MKKGWNLVLAWLGLWLTAVGMYLGIVSIFEDRITQSPVYLWLGILCLLFTVICLNKRRAVVATGTVISALCGGGYIWLHYGKLQNDWKMILWFANERYVKYTGNTMMKINDIHGAHIMGNTLLFLVCAGIVYLAALFVMRKGIFGLAWVATGEVVSLGLLFGNAPNILAITFLILGYGVMALLCTVRVHNARGKKRILKEQYRQNSGGHRVAVLSCVCILALCTTLAYFVTARIEPDVMIYAPSFQKQQKKIEKYINKKLTATVLWMKSALGTDDNGLLTNTSPKYRNVPVMEVRVDFKPNAPIYLRGFTGCNYTNGQWSASDADFSSQYTGGKLELWNNMYREMQQCSTFMQQDDESVAKRLNSSPGMLGAMYRDLLDEIDEKGWNEKAMQSDYLAYMRSGLENSIHRGKMSIQYERGFRRGTIAYMPYFCNLGQYDLSSNVKIRQDLGFDKKANSYEVGFYLISQNKQKSYVDWMQNGGGELFREEADVTGNYMNTLDYAEYDNTPLEDMPLESQYYEYADRQYGLYNAGDSKMFRKLISNVCGNDTTVYRENHSEAIGIVRSLLWQNTSYNTKIDPLPQGKDYAEYFYFEQRKGFCEHYATAATIMLRHMSIPARYVSGYRIDPDAFELDEDGKYTAKVMDSDAHAWTETLQEYTGWTPWEVTPDDTQKTVDDTVNVTPSLEPAADIQKNIQKQADQQKATEQPKEEVTPTPTSTVTPSPTPTSENQSSGQHDTHEVQTDRQYHVLLRIILVVAVLMCGITAQRSYRRRWYSSLVRECTAAGRKGAALCTKWVIRTMRLSGYRLPRNADLQDFLAALREKFASALSEDEWDEYERLLKKAAYSKEGVDASEQSECYQYSSRINAYLWSNCKWFGKLRLLLWGRK